MLICPDCQGGKIVKNGRTHYGRQNHKCKDCKRQFVDHNQHTITPERQEDVAALLRERISLRGIARAMTVSITWLMDFAVQQWKSTPEDLGVPWEMLELIDPKELQLVRLQADEMWSFVGCKTTRQWIWVIYWPELKQVLAYHMGGRGKQDAWRLWDKLPADWRANCRFETDYWEAYFATLSCEQHTASKALTYFVEGYFSGVRARVSRLVRRGLSFSKKLANHVAAIGYFFWHRNLDSHPYI